jgi:hypothetical protein
MGGSARKGLKMLDIRDYNDAIVISRNRYEELIKAETTLEILCAMIEKEKPYKYEDYKVIAGDYITESEKEREDE